MDYTALKSAVADWLARGDLTTRVPDFIAMGQDRIYRRLRHRKMERSYIRALDADNRAPIPSDFIQIKNFFVFQYNGALPGDGTTTLDLEEANLVQLEPANIESEYNVYNTFALKNGWVQRQEARAGGRLTYTVIRQGEEFLVRPPNTDLPNLGGMYYAKLPLLSDANLENFLTDDATDLLIRASCLEGAVFIKDTEGIAYWTQMFEQSLAELAGEAIGMETAGGPLFPKLRGP